MTFRVSPLVLCAVLAPLVSAGCYAYNPSGFGGQPPIFSSPPVQPGSLQGGVIQTIQPTQPIGPQAATPATPLVIPPAASENPVPIYKDPTDEANPAAEALNSKKMPSIDPPYTASSGPAIPIDPAPGPVTAAAATTSPDDAAFTSPTTVAPDTDAPAIPYGYDRDNHLWLRGVVEYVEADRAWHIMYDDAPDANDQFGGDLSLADDPRLAKLRDGDVIQVEGQVDPQARDARGKPRYRISKLSVAE